MSHKRLKSRDKTVQKMTRDGLVEHNLTEKTEQRVSNRLKDVDFKRPTTTETAQARADSDQSVKRHSSISQRNANMNVTPTEEKPFVSNEYKNFSDHCKENLRQVGKVGFKKDKERLNFENKVVVEEIAKPLPFENPPKHSTLRGTKYYAEKQTTKAQNEGSYFNENELQKQTSNPKIELSQTNEADRNSTTHEPRNSRLHFTESETPPKATETAKSASLAKQQKQLNKFEKRTTKANVKLEKAQANLSKRRALKVKREFDEQTGKAKTRLTFEKEIKSPRNVDILGKTTNNIKITTNKASAEIGNNIHNTISRHENDNTGVKAAHKTEQKAEQLYKTGKRAKLSFQNRNFKKAAKLERKSIKANTKLQYKKLLYDNPKLQKAGLLRKTQQKKLIKKQYAKTARYTANSTKTIVSQTVKMTTKLAKLAAQVLSKAFPYVGVVVAIVFIFILLASVLSSCSVMLTQAFTPILASSYLAEDKDINDSELYFTELEADLQLEINNIENSNPSYDEYRYNIAEISHNPYELMAYLTSKYEHFSFSEIQADLQAIFDEQYNLILTPITERRSRKETYTDSDGDTHTRTVYYDWHILNVTLTRKPLNSIVNSRMTAEQKEMYGVYMETKGNRQYFDNPFDFNWTLYVTSPFGYRVDPFTGEKKQHKGVDIALPEGTPIKATHNGTVTTATYSDSYGYYVVIEGEDGLQSKYAHCSELLVSQGQAVEVGTEIAKVGSTGQSTGTHLHLEILRNGEYLNPYYFVVTGSGYIDGTPESPWNGGTGGAGDTSGIPPEALEDEDFAALMAEATKYIGRPYVWGGSNPSTGFDCSGFVCWSYTQSGVYDLPRTTAQGIYDQCTPVSADNAKPGDLVFFTGTYDSVGAVSHIGIYVGDGKFLHCGDPIGYANLNSPYWSSHFYDYGRLE